MTAPYTPTAFSTPVVNPAAGGSGAPPIPYLSNAQYQAAPTAMDAKSLTPLTLAETISRAGKWADNVCFGADVAAKGASLAASLSVQSAYVPLRSGELRLVCDYRPVVEVVGIDVGADPSSVQTVGPVMASMTRIGMRTITVPLGSGPWVSRGGDSGVSLPVTAVRAGRYYAVWSYVNGYPHTSLAAAALAGATTLVVRATDGNGGLWGVYPGSQLTIVDDANGTTESVTVNTVTPGTATCTLGVSALQYAHQLPNAPDFLPVTALSADVQQAVISLTTMLIKTRGARALVMPQMPGGRPAGQALAQAGALEDFEIAARLLEPYTVHSKGNR